MPRMVMIGVPSDVEKLTSGANVERLAISTMLFCFTASAVYTDMAIGVDCAFSSLCWAVTTISCSASGFGAAAASASAAVAAGAAESKHSISVMPAPRRISPRFRTVIASPSIIQPPEKKSGQLFVKCNALHAKCNPLLFPLQSLGYGDQCRLRERVWPRRALIRDIGKRAHGTDALHFAREPGTAPLPMTTSRTPPRFFEIGS